MTACCCYSGLRAATTVVTAWQHASRGIYKSTRTLCKISPNVNHENKRRPTSNTNNSETSDFVYANSEEVATSLNIKSRLLPHVSNTSNAELFGDEAQNSSILGPCTEDISHVAPYFQPAFNFAAYVNKSPTLQELVKLGVDLHKLEKRKGIPEAILQLDFDRDIKGHIRYLHDIGVPSDELGHFLTKNPLIVMENVEDLDIRINYLRSKRFTPQMITEVVRKNPYWLMFSTKRIDTRLGFFQNCFSLSGNEVRKISVRCPKLITSNINHVKLISFTVQEELGFDSDETKTLLVNKPALWMRSKNSLWSRFDYVHNIMKISHEEIILHAQVLQSRLFRIKQRHQFLELIGRAQFNPKLDSYISLGRLVAGTDAEFCENVAKVSVQSFNEFLKSL